MVRIAVVGSTSSDTFADNLLDAGKRGGHEVIGVGSAQPRIGPEKFQSLIGIVAEKSPKFRSQIQGNLVEETINFRPEVIIVVDRRLSAESLSRMKAKGAKAVLWFPDAVHNMGRHDMFFAGYDRFFFKNPIVVKQLKDIYGIRAEYLPEGANPKWHYPIGEYGTEPYLTVAGNLYPTRAVLLDRLLAAGVPVRIFGAPLPAWINLPRVRAAHTKRTITKEEKSRVFRSSVAVLNNLHPAEFAGSNCRLFEATASGAVVLTEARPGMERLFDYNSQVVPFRNFDELVGSYRKLLNEPEYARNIADSAAERAATDHTWDERLEQLLTSLQ